jgi:hypothetical protein
MHEMVLSSGRDAMLVAIPLLGLLLVGFFRLDSLLAAPRVESLENRKRRPAPGLSAEGEPLVSDPDGVRWGAIVEPGVTRRVRPRAD